MNFQSGQIENPPFGKRESKGVLSFLTFLKKLSQKVREGLRGKRGISLRQQIQSILKGLIRHESSALEIPM